MQDRVVIIKFGGTSVSQNLETLAHVVARQVGRRIVVVSAIKGVTNLLVAMADGTKPTSALDLLIEQHVRLIGDSFAGGPPATLLQEMEVLFVALAELLGKPRGEHGFSPRQRDAILSFGERLSSTLLTAFLACRLDSVCLFDARKVIVTDDCHGDASPLLDESKEMAHKTLLPLLESKQVVVTQGFIGATDQGVTTTIGRGGSDVTATFLANLVSAEEVHIWTDVNGVLSADPRTVPQPETIAHLKHNEISLLAHFGTHVLHPRTIDHLLDRSISLRVRNTFQPDHPATLICNRGHKQEPCFIVTGTEVAVFFQHKEGRKLTDTVSWHPDRGISLSPTDPVGAMLDTVVNQLKKISGENLYLVCVMWRELEVAEDLVEFCRGIGGEVLVPLKSFSMNGSDWFFLLVEERDQQWIVRQLHAWFDRKTASVPACIALGV